jgi:hypothetical protein
MNVHEVRWRLLQDHLREVSHDAQRRMPVGLFPDSEMLLRLAELALTLLERHTTDTRGQCLVPGCSRRRRMPWRRSRTCPIFVTAQFWVEQPLAIVLKLARHP